jgi:hypothetical protein
MVGSITEERANVIAAGLAQIPQKVRWSYALLHLLADSSSVKLKFPDSSSSSLMSLKTQSYRG